MKIVVFRRRWVTVVGCAVAAVAMFGVVTNPAAVGAAATAALTFDAAWGDASLRQPEEEAGERP